MIVHLRTFSEVNCYTVIILFSIFKRLFPLFGVVEHKERQRKIRLGKLQCQSDFRCELYCTVLPVEVIQDINFNTSISFFDVVDNNYTWPFFGGGLI
jgi:hypothetical protein